MEAMPDRRSQIISRCGMLVAVATILLACGPSPGASRTGDSNGSADRKPTITKRVTAAIMGNPASPIGRLTGFGQRGADAVEELVHVGLTNMDREGRRQPVLGVAVPT